MIRVFAIVFSLLSALTSAGPMLLARRDQLTKPVTINMSYPGKGSYGGRVRSRLVRARQRREWRARRAGWGTGEQVADFRNA